MQAPIRGHRARLWKTASWRGRRLGSRLRRASLGRNGIGPANDSVTLPQDTEKPDVPRVEGPLGVLSATVGDRDVDGPLAGLREALRVDQVSRVHEHGIVDPE